MPGDPARVRRRRKDMTNHELTTLLALARRPQVGCSRQEIIDAGVPEGSIGHVVGSAARGAGGLITRGYVVVTEPELPTGGRYWYKITPRGHAALKRVLAEAEAGVVVRHIVADGPVGGNRMKEFVALPTPPLLTALSPAAGVGQDVQPNGAVGGDEQGGPLTARDDQPLGDTDSPVE